MNISLLGLIGKWISLLFISIISLFDIGNYNEKNIQIENETALKNLTVINRIIEHETVVKYNSKIPNNITNVLEKGTDKVVIVDNNNKVIQSIQEPAPEVIEKGTGNYGIYVGRLSGYGPDCVGCTGTGNLACKTREKTTHSLLNNGIYYSDSEYGKVRILSAALKAFPCGTIIEVKKPGKDSFFAVVLDTGTTMNNEWAKGNVWIDLAYSSQTDKTVFGTDGLTGTNITFSVQRWGW